MPDDKRQVQFNDNSHEIVRKRERGKSGPQLFQWDRARADGKRYTHVEGINKI